MRTIFIIHGSYGNPQENWFPWLERELEDKGWRVWTPDLPGADSPSIPRYNAFILSKWTFDSDSIIVGHSSGAVAALGLLEEAPDKTVIDRAFLVAGFIGDLGWDALKELSRYTLDWLKIRKKARKFILIHSDDDPYVPLQHGESLKEKLDAELIVLRGQKHFSLEAGPQYKEFPELLEKILA